MSAGKPPWTTAGHAGVAGRGIGWTVFVMAGLIFLAAFGTLAASFVLWGAGGAVLPVTLMHTLTIHWVLKGKIAAAAEYD